MVRSKFPGKPSKIISRKIVDSAKFTLLEDNESAEATESISYGLAMFNGSFGGDSQLDTAFHGFSPHDVKEAALASKELKEKVLAEYDGFGLSKNSKDVVKVVLDPPPLQSFEYDPSLLPWIEVTKKGHPWPYIPSTDTSTSINLDGAPANIQKFALPSCSINSARVIKPNKRFLETEEPASVDQKESYPQNKQLRTIELKKPRLILHDIKSVVTSASVSNQDGNNVFRAFISSGSMPESSDKCHWKVCDKVQGGLSDLNVFGASVSQPCFHSVQSAKKNDNGANFGDGEYFTLSSSTMGMFGSTKPKVNEKQCVLKRNSAGFVITSERSLEGGFASQSKKRNGFGHSKVMKSSGTPVECGVCGAVRYYRFVKQARKFGIDSCESCRKFIAKMVIRARSLENFVKCSGGQGNCFVPAVIRSTDSNSKENRCWACWLEKCVRTYVQMPEGTRKSLIAMLPANMQSLKSRSQKPKSSSSDPSCVPKSRTKRKAESTLCKTGGLTRPERPSRLKEVKLNDLPSKIVEPDCSQSRIARQQLVQKGPRVKHVCRSASIVLGQPLAVFEPKPKPSLPASSLTIKETLPSTVAPAKQMEPEPCRQSSRLLESKLSKMAGQSANQTSYTNQSLSGRRVTRLPQDNIAAPFQGHARSLQALSVCNNQPEMTPDLVALDFWESYDPDEVCNTGFGLIGCDPFQVRAVCFLCGSAGTSKLIHCASCCEPYHRFCVEIGDPLPVEDKWEVDWVCPRCTVCSGCGWSTGPQVNCQRCDRSYHVNCLGATAIKARERTPDRAWVCSSCLRCKSCNGPDVVKFVGNLPFCKPCFKLRRKGNFCPLCQCCYSENDFHSKMMECAVCKAWVHAKCEGLSDEKYQILSYLPVTVEFVCRLCCISPEAAWRSAVESELKGGYLNVVKALTKNRKACTLLKWSPRKSCCSCPKPESNPGRRRLSFSSTLSKVPRRNQPEIVTKPEISLYDFDEEESKIGKYVHRSTKAKKIQDDSETTVSQDKGAQFSPLTGSQSDSGIGSTDDEFKTFSAAEEEEMEMSSQLEGIKKSCDLCEAGSPIPSLFRIKKKVNSDQYSSILEFHQDMDSVMNEAESEELRDLYHYTLHEVFPWFDPEYPNTSHNWREAASPCKPLQGSVIQHQSTLPSSTIPQAVNELIMEGVREMGNDYFYGGRSLVPDMRLCGLCKGKGDCPSFEQGRLLYCGYNEWIHVNCALWSGEVFEEIDGSLQNINSALSRSRLIRCLSCGKKGASIGCCSNNCQQTYHFPCARSVGCFFMEDKTVYCPLHKKDAQDKAPANQSDFYVARPVYVELDRRKKKRVESRQVRLMIGSLLIDSLGSILPEVSDQGTTLVPTQFRCSRLFWSVKEPWRIVEYTIRTSVQMPTEEEPLHVHVTVDHSKEGEASENLCVAANVPAEETEVVPRETEEEVSDPQNSADLLPPELKDAIFEELPHDLLDGISMQDIFPRFLSMEDPNEDTCDQVMRDARPTNHVTKRLKRSKSDVLPDHVASNTDSRLHQRSCSLAWSCKLDTTLTRCKRSFTDSDDRSRIIQQLHLSVTPATNMDAHLLLGGDKENHSLSWRHPQTHIMQVDGAFDAEPSLASVSYKKFSKPLKETVACSRPTPTFLAKNCEPKICRPRMSRLTWRRPSYDRIPQLDGAAESSDSDADDAFKSAVNQQAFHALVEERPVKCDRCYCTYRTEMSYTRHLPTCTGDLSSGSEEEHSEDESPNSTPTKRAPMVETSPVAASTSKAPTVTPTVASTLSLTPPLTTNPAPIITSAPTVNLASTVNTTPIVRPTSFVTAASNAPSSHPIVTSLIAGAPPVFAAPPIVPSAPIVRPTPILAKPLVPPEKSAVRLAPLRRHPAEPVIRAPNTVARPLKPTLSNTTTTIGTQAGNANVFCQPAPQPMVAMVDYQPQQPNVIVQCVPSPAMMPAYVDAFQQHTGQTLQHLATIDAHIPLEGAYITAVPNTVIPRTFQLQATADGQLRLEPTNAPQLGLSQLGLQPQMMGTILPTCGVVTTDGVYPGNMLLTNQPMLTCMETVVSNTYMSMTPNQFMPGVLAGSSSFSSTTTQVFQAGKHNPEVPTSFVLTSDSQHPNQLVVRSQPTQAPAQIKLPDLFTQSQVTQPQTLSPPVLTQMPAQSRPSVQRTYSKPSKSAKPEIALALKTLTQPVQASRESPGSSNLLISPAPAQSITLPDPIAPPLSSDEALPSPKGSNPVTPARNCNMPKSIAVVHPIPVSTYSPQDRSKNLLIKKPAVVLSPAVITNSDKTQCTSSVPRTTSTATVAKTTSKQFASVESKADEYSKLSAQLIAKSSVSSVPVSQSAIFTPTRTTVPSTSETLSFACKPSPRTVALTAASSRPVITSASITKPISTVLPTSCLPNATKPSEKQDCGGSLPQVISKSSFNHQLLSEDQRIDPPEVAEDVTIVGDPAIDQPIAENTPAAVTVSPPSLTDPLVRKSVNRTSSPETKADVNSTSEPQTTLKLLFQKQTSNGRYKVSTSKLDSATRPIENGCLKEKNSEKDQPVNSSAAVQPEGSENVNPGCKASKKSQPNNSTPKIVYEINCQDGFTYSSTSISDAWQKVFGAVQEARSNHNMAPLVHNPFSGADTAHNVLGLGNNSLKYLLEQLPSVNQCTQYRPIYHKSRLPAGGAHLVDDKPCAESTTGCARTEPYMCPKRFDMFSWLDSRHRCPPKLLDNSDADGLSGRRATSMNLPMAMRYRHLRETARTAVGVYRSDIHGRGLFCLRDIEAGEMVIEYAGEVIRNTLTDNRERYYQSKGIGCYMFKVDENFTVDATRRGNAARFINHSCEPNCYSRVVDILGKKHIIIFAFRRIPQGEELTYDYKFPIEDEKISCHCLSRRCRKYLN